MWPCLYARQGESACSWLAILVMVWLRGFSISCFTLKIYSPVSHLTFYFLPLSMFPTLVIVCPSLSPGIPTSPMNIICVLPALFVSSPSLFLCLSVPSPHVFSGFWFPLFSWFVLCFAFLLWISLVMFFAFAGLVLLPFGIWDFTGFQLYLMKLAFGSLPACSCISGLGLFCLTLTHPW